MPHGLQIFDAAGNIVLDLDHRIMRILTVQTVAGGSGNVWVPPGAYTITPVINTTDMSHASKAIPRVIVQGDGNTSWDYGSVAANDRANSRVMLSAY